MANSVPSPLRIAVLGVGNIGSTFAFQLARVGGHDVTAIARPGSVRLKQLRRDGAIINVAGDRATVRVAGVIDAETHYDLVLITLLAHQVDAVLPALQRSPATCIQFMFNTFEPERLQQAVGIGRCALGMNFIQAMLDADGKLKSTIGAGGQKTFMDQQRWVDVFIAAGLPAPAPVVAAMLWSMSRVRSFRELLAAARPECVALVDALVAAAPPTNPPPNVAAILAMKPS